LTQFATPPLLLFPPLEKGGRGDSLLLLLLLLLFIFTQHRRKPRPHTQTPTAAPKLESRRTPIPKSAHIHLAESPPASNFRHVADIAVTPIHSFDRAPV